MTMPLSTSSHTYMIKPADNGYIVEHSYRENFKDDAGELDYRYREKRLVYTNWDDVAAWVKDNALEIPPQ